MARLFSFGALIVGGLIIADILTHGPGVQAAASGFSTASTPVIHGLLGSTA